MKSTLVIGDVHSNLRALEDLLIQEGIIGPCDACGASGDVSEASEAEFCPGCKGDGLTRLNRAVEVVQLGDLGDYRAASMTSDSMIVNFADTWIDIFLRGNHEEPVFAGPTFGGYARPLPETKHRLDLWRHERRLLLAYEAHGFLITHAGLGDHAFDDYPTGSLKRSDPWALARWINRKDRDLPHKWDPNTFPVRDNISWYRGGSDEHGGLLWRDSREGLFDIRQVFGHTSHELALSQETKAGLSYCIDTSKHGSLSAIWLPSEKVIRTPACSPSR